MCSMKKTIFVLFITLLSSAVNSENKPRLPKCRIHKKNPTTTIIDKPMPTSVSNPNNTNVEKLYGLGYNAKHSTGECSNLQKVVEDFKYLKQYTDRIRTFGLFDCNQGPLLLEASKQTKIKISLGMFINQYEQEFTQEFNLLKTMINQNRLAFKNVEYIIVGSESFYRKETTLKQLSDYVEIVRQYLKSQDLTYVKVTCADIKDSWYPSELTKSVDSMFVNAYPYWEGISIENAIDHLFVKINEAKNRVPNKELILSETGWPEGGQNFGNAIASKENQLKYFKLFVCRAKRENLKYYWFSAFDEAWKQTEDKMNWGVFQENHQLKPGYPNPLVSC